MGLDFNKVDQALTRKLEKIDRNWFANSNRKPVEDYDRYFFRVEIPYKDAIVQAKVILAKERLTGLHKGVYLDTMGGPWLLFRIEDVLEGDNQGLICPGTAVLARWNNRSKVYDPYIEKEDPVETDLEVLSMAAILNITEREIIEGRW